MSSAGRPVPAQRTLVSRPRSDAAGHEASLFIGREGRGLRVRTTGTRSAFERQLYVIRRSHGERRRRPARSLSTSVFYIPSLSSRTLIYKGMLTAPQIEPIFRTSAIPRSSLRCAGAPALQHEHVSVVGAGASVSSTSRTTARSIRCAATSTGCARAKRAASPICSATTCSKVLPIIREGAAIRRCSTTCCELVATRAGRCRTPSS